MVAAQKGSLAFVKKELKVSAGPEWVHLGHRVTPEASVHGCCANSG